MPYYSLEETASILDVTKQTLRRWDLKGKLVARRHPNNNYRLYKKEQVERIEKEEMLRDGNLLNVVTPDRNYYAIELFAGAGGLALGLHEAGIKCSLLNEIDVDAAKTLKNNMQEWNVVVGDVRTLSMTKYKNKIDIVTGGFPCQAFSYAGKKLGFKDTRGTLFYEFARIINEVQPKIFLAENVRGLLNHNGGRTLSTIVSVFKEVGYRVITPKVLKAINYNVPQKRERLIIVGIRNDIKSDYNYPLPNSQVFTLKDALRKGALFKSDVPHSSGVNYPVRKKKILDLVPPGGYWRDLPKNIQKKYMMKSYFLGGGKTGIARRISWNEPSLTLTCSPCQKQTERCHPDETRPFTIREYARIQTFPDHWIFAGTVTSQYKQIGNAVPVNMGKELGYSIIKFLNDYYKEKI